MGRYLDQQAQRVDSRYRQLKHPRSRVLLNQKQLRAVSGRLANAMQSQFRADRSRVSNQTGRLKTQQPLRRVLRQLAQVSVLTNRLRRTQTDSITRGRQKFESLGSQLQMVSPLATLQRGFSITRNQQDEIIRDAHNNLPGDNVKIQLKSGSLHCEIQEIVK
jgi:exodeoxyribonuclease VII large subunit